MWSNAARERRVGVRAEHREGRALKQEPGHPTVRYWVVSTAESVETENFR